MRFCCRGVKQFSQPTHGKARRSLLVDSILKILQKKKEDFAANADYLFFLDPQSSTEEDADEQVKDLVDLSLKKMVCSGLYACLILYLSFLITGSDSTI